jgi:hypothetical protein
VILSGASMAEANLSYARLDQAEIIETNLERCDLSHSILWHTSLRGTILAGAILTQASLEGTDVSEFNFCSIVAKSKKMGLMSRKNELLEAIAGKNRGILASPTDKTAILAAIACLEDLNPTPNPVEAIGLLDGDWRLIYTNSQGLLGFERIPLLQLGEIYQCIRASAGKVYNLAEINGIPYLEGLISVEARFEALTNKRVNVFFQKTLIGLKRLMNYSQADLWIEQLEAGKQPLSAKIEIDSERPPGWLEITYLDEDLRIGRGNRGSVFVLTKA